MCARSRRRCSVDDRRSSQPNVIAAGAADAIGGKLPCHSIDSSGPDVDVGRSRSLAEGGLSRKERLAEYFGVAEDVAADAAPLGGGSRWARAALASASVGEPSAVEPLHGHKRYQKLKTLHR